MVHDFAKSAQRHREQLARENRKKPFPAGLLIITLLAATGFGAFLYYLTQVQPELNKPAALPVEDRSIKTTPNASQPPRENASEGFDFYTLLPESEVIAPEVEAYNYKNKSDSAGTSAWILQAGSFRNKYDADRLRAKLILDGLDVSISRIKGKHGEYWHRVLVGPFTSRSRLNHAQDILARANTQTLVLKIKP